MKSNRVVTALRATLIAFGLFSGGANGALTIYFEDVGSDLRVTIAGSVDTSSVSLLGTYNNWGFEAGSYYNQFGSIGAAGAASYLVHGGNPLFDPTANTFNFGFPIIRTGDAVSIWALDSGEGGNLILPEGYVSNTPILGSSTFADAQIADMGLTTGLWMTLDTGDTVSISTSPIPEPSSVFLIGFGVFGLVARRRRFH